MNIIKFYVTFLTYKFCKFPKIYKRAYFFTLWKKFDQPYEIYTLPSEIVRTVLVSAIKNHCWLWTTISRWKDKIGHFLKKQLESLWNFTSGDAHRIFFWPSENNTAHEELKKKFKIFSNSLPQLQLLAWPRENFSKAWKLYYIESKMLSSI